MDLEDRAPLLVVDSHTAGNPTRILLSGLKLPDAITSVLDARAWLRDSADWVRRRLVHEPRGGGLTCAVVPLLREGEAWDLGAVILEPGSYPPMCGHCMIGLSAVVAELELVPAARPRARDQVDLRIMTPAGLVGSSVRRGANGELDVTLENVESFVVSTFECEIEGRTVEVALVYGGDYYLTVDADGLDLRLERPEASRIATLAQAVRSAVPDVARRDPDTGAPLDVYQVMFFRRLANDPRRARVVVVAPPGVIDRSPCGTGSSALLALLLARGVLSATETLVTESIIGTEFELRVASARTVGDRTVIRPTVTGSAYINGFLTIVADRRDDLRDGFEPL